MNKVRSAHLLATAGIGVVALYTLAVAADRWPSSPVGQLMARIRGQKGSTS